MANWLVVRLGDHVDLHVGFAFKSKEFTDDPHDIRLVRGANIGQGTLKWGQERRFPGERHQEFEKYHLRAGDVVLAMDRPWIAAGLKWAVVSKDDVPALLVQRVARLRGTATLAHEFLRYVIGSPEFEAYVQPIVTGVNVPHISASQIADFRFRLPPIEAQREISRLLGGFDELIENNSRRIEILEEMARLIYREWFVHFRFPGHDDVELIDSDVGPVPKGWDVTSLAEHVELQRENVNPGDCADEEFDHYSIPAFDADRLPVVEPGSAIKSGKYRLDANCVLLSKLNPRFARVWRASPGRSARRSICSTEFLVLKATGDWPDPFVFSVVSAADFGGRLASMAGGTSTSHQRAKPQDVMALRLAGPPRELVAAFTDRVRPMLDLADNLVLQNDVLSRARDLLLPRLISGELDVSDLDLDLEPVA